MRHRRLSPWALGACVLLVASCTDSPSGTGENRAPEVTIHGAGQAQADLCTEANLALAIGWEARDPDGFIRAVRYLVAKVGDAAEGCMSFSEYADWDPIRRGEFDDLWSDWVSYSPHTGFLDWPSGVSLERFPRTEIGSAWLIAVQARDGEGALTERFEWGKNVWHVQLTHGHPPTIRVVETNSGWSDDFENDMESRPAEFRTNQQVHFAWGEPFLAKFAYVETYQYGWNVADVDDPDDSGWATDPGWVTETPPRTFAPGDHSLSIRATNNSGLTTVARIAFTVK